MISHRIIYSLTSLSFNCLLKAGDEILYKEGSMESKIFGPRCFRDLLPLTVQLPNVSTSCGSRGCMGVGLIYRRKQMIEINRYSTPVQIICMNLSISRMYISLILRKFKFLYNCETLDL